MELQRLVLPDSVMVAIPDSLLDLLEVSVDDVHQMFLTIYLMYEETRDDIWDVFSDLVFDGGSRALDQDAKLHDLINCYLHFKDNLDPYVHFLHRPPPGFVVSYIEMTHRPGQLVFELEMDTQPMDEDDGNI